jgi:superfamily II DNA or RNA helicase
MIFVPVVVGGEITIFLKDLPQIVADQIRAALTFVNEDKAKKLAERIWGAWNDPDFITLWKEEQRRGGDHVLLLPRGFAWPLVQLLRANGCEPVWDDRRSRSPAYPGYFKPFELRDYQATAVAALLQAEQGFLEQPAGAGKTTLMLGLMTYAQQKTLVIVDKAGLVEQWRERAVKFLNLKIDQVGKIGENVWEERDLTICLRQTLWSRLWELDATQWFDNYGLVIFDEGHHLSSETLTEICRRCRSYYLFGTSATPAKSETRGNIVHALVGPIVHKTTREDLYERNILVKPSVEIIRTGFQADFWPTHETDATQSCQVPGCRKNGTEHMHRNNYASVLKKLVEDNNRNEMIAQRIVSERGHVHLVASRQLKHLDLLRKACESAGWDGPIYMLRGEENAAGLSQYIAEAIHEGGQWEMIYEESAGGEEWQQTSHTGEYGKEAIIFSTVADEGLDIPPIDRIHLAFPMRQEAAIIQLVGRCERIYEGKDNSIIVDYSDRCDVFAQQAVERDRVFRYIGFEVNESTHA